MLLAGRLGGLKLTRNLGVQLTLFQQGGGQIMPQHLTTSLYLNKLRYQLLVVVHSRGTSSPQVTTTISTVFYRSYSKDSDFLVKIRLRAENMKYLQLMVASLVALEFCAFVSSVDLQSSIYSDPGRYYAKSNQQKQRRRLKNKVGYLFRVLELGYIFNFDCQISPRNVFEL